MAEQVLGKILNEKYRLLSVLGEGAMGMVYRAEQLDVTGRSLREVALKTLRPALSNDENFSRRFLDEVRVAAQLRSAHIVTLYDVGADENGQLYYTMEFVRGQTLKEVLQQEGPLAIARVAAITEQICDALTEAHSLPHPIVHRDLKPANIFIEQRREGELVKVGDFGIAKILGEQHTQHTAVGTPGPGTPRYMAPEQWKGAELSNRTDLYALGGMMYELLSGIPPFVVQGGGIEALMYQHLTQSPPPLPVTIPAEIRSLIGRLLAKEPADRPQDALVVSQILKTALIGAQEEKTTILQAAEEVATEILAPTGRRDTGEQHSSQPILLKQPDLVREISRPQGTISSSLEKKAHKKREGKQARTTGRIVAAIAVILGLFLAGRVLFMGDETLPENQQTVRGITTAQSPLDEKPLPSPSASSSSLSMPTDKPPVEPLPSLPQGSLLVSVNVEAAKVSLNGEYIGMARSGTPLEVAKLAVGQQQVRVEAGGYESMEYTANIQDGKLTTLEFPLARLLSAPPSASVLVPPDRSRPVPTSTNPQQQVVPPSSGNENTPAGVFSGPEGKPISKSQLERRRKMLRNRENRAVGSLGVRNRRIPPDFPRSRPKVPRNQTGRSSGR